MRLSPILGTTVAKVKCIICNVVTVETRKAEYLSRENPGSSLKDTCFTGTTPQLVLSTSLCAAGSSQ